MDYTNCSMFLGTDHLFQASPPGTCDSSLIFVWVVYGLILLLRFIAAGKKWEKHFKRKREGLKTSPLGPVLVISLAISYLIFLILFLTNLITIENGFSFSAYTICYLYFAALYSLSLFRMVRLGAKIVSLSKEQLDPNSPSLEKLDRFGYFFVGIAFFGLLVMSTVLIFAGPIHPESDVLFGQIGWASKGVFQMCISCGLIWQLQRCHILISKKMPYSPRQVQILARLRRNQFHYTIFGASIGFYYYLLAARVFPWYWWTVVGITSFAESMAAFVFEFRAWYPGNGSATRATTNNNNQIVAVPNPLKSDNSSQENSQEKSSSELQQPQQRMGLGILNIASKRNKTFKANMTRVTEVSEGGLESIGG